MLSEITSLSKAKNDLSSFKRLEHSTFPLTETAWFLGSFSQDSSLKKKIMSILSFNNTSSIIPQMSKSSASFYKTEELPTLSKMNLVIYV